MPSFRVGTTIMLFDSRGFIYLQKHRFWKDQMWGLPGGFLQRNETPLSGAKREVFEETNLLPQQLKLLDVIQSSSSTVNIVFTGNVTDTEFRIQKFEVIEGGFFDPDNLPEPLLKWQKEAIGLFISGGNLNSES